jgi:hypothetical protein
MYKLNQLHTHAFETFTQINSNKKILQYVGGAIEIGKTQIIKAIQNYLKEK